MKKVKALVLAGLVGSALIVTSGVAAAEDISGVIVRTLMLSEDTRLVGDVMCKVTGAPCVAFGAPNVSLLLNGFTMTGPADAVGGCAGTSVGTETGISTNGQSNVGIRGPGVVQRFRGDGILFIALVESNTAIGNTNGIVVFPSATNNRVRGNVVVGNPPIQQSNSVPAGGGVDIWDQSAPGNGNTFTGNMCVSAINAPCPAFSTTAVPRKPGN